MTLQKIRPVRKETPKGKHLYGIKVEVRKHVNIAMTGDLSFLFRMDKEQNKEKNPLDLAMGRGKLNKQNSSKGENK